MVDYLMMKNSLILLVFQKVTDEYYYSRCRLKIIKNFVILTLYAISIFSGSK
jgi:hypothetical protein